jgi:hypothetical protein
LDKTDIRLNNKNNRIKNFLNKNINSIIFLLLLTVIVTVVTYYRILVQIHIGPVSDTVDFFTNALVFAGQGIGYSDLTRPPFFSFITSLFIRMGYTSINTIFYVDGGLFIFGVIGLFMLLKVKFNDLESFLGGLLYATFPILLTILAVGFSDISSVSFSIWAIYFMVLAVKKDSRFFYLAFPFAMFAFLTRYNNALLIFPIFLYILINKDKVNFKNIILGIVASILVIIPVLIFFNEKFGNIIYTFMNFESTSTVVSGSIESAVYNPNIFFYIQMFPRFVGPQGITIMLIILLGTFLYLVLYFIRNNRDNKKLFEEMRLNKYKLILFFVLGIIFLASFGKIVYMISEILFFIFVYIFYEITKINKFKNLELHLMFFTWFMAFFIFSSVFVIKDNRYFLLMAPPVIYFMILGLHEISNAFNLRIKDRNVIFPVLAIMLTVIIVLSTATQIPNILQANNDKVTTNEQIELASQWFVSYDPNYKNQNIYSDLWPNFSWYLKTNVKPVPIFKNNQTIKDGGVTNNTFNQADSNQYNNYLLTNNADYYLCVRPGLNLTSYNPIKKFGIITIYKKI